MFSNSTNETLSSFCTVTINFSDYFAKCYQIKHLVLRNIVADYGATCFALLIRFDKRSRGDAFRAQKGKLGQD